MTFLPRDWDSHPPLIYSDYKSTNLRGPTRPLVLITKLNCIARKAAANQITHKTTLILVNF